MTNVLLGNTRCHYLCGRCTFSCTTNTSTSLKIWYVPFMATVFYDGTEIFQQDIMLHCIHCIEIVSRTWKWLHYAARATKLPRFQYYRALMGNVGPTSSLYRTSTIFKETALNILTSNPRGICQRSYRNHVWSDKNCFYLVYGGPKYY